MREWWGKLSSFQKILIGGGIVVIIMSMVLILGLRGGEGEYALLYSDMRLKDAGAVVKNLEELKIGYKLREGGTAILVPSDKVYKARITLANKGIPRGGVVGYEIFDKTGIGVTAFVQEVNYKRALEGELVRTIRALDEVESARVHLVLVEERLFEEDQKEPTASVVLKLRGSLKKSQIKGISHLIASSVEGLKAERVTIVDSYGNLLYGGKGEGGDFISSYQFETKQEVESYLSGKAQSMLEKIVGVGNAVVRVDVEIDFTEWQKSLETWDPEGQVIRSRENQLRPFMDRSQEPPLRDDEKHSVTNYEISKTIETIVNKGGIVEYLSISAIVNGVYEPSGEGRVKYTPRSEEELVKFQEIVKNAVGYNKDRGDQIEVTSIPFGLPPAEIEEAAAMPWLSVLSALRPVLMVGIIGAVVIVVFLMMRKLIRGAAQARAEAAAAAAAERERREREGEEIVAGEKEEKVATREKLKKEIEEDPEKTARILQQMMGS